MKIFSLSMANTNRALFEPNCRGNRKPILLNLAFQHTIPCQLLLFHFLNHVIVVQLCSLSKGNILLTLQMQCQFTSYTNHNLRYILHTPIITVPRGFSCAAYMDIKLCAAV
jgi:hypothetical protein